MVCLCSAVRARSPPRPEEMAFGNFQDLKFLNKQNQNLGITDIIGINTIDDHTFAANAASSGAGANRWFETKLAQEQMNPILFSLEILSEGGCLLIWNLGISSRLNIGMTLSLIYCFHKVLLVNCFNCQVLVCKGYRRAVGLEMIYKITEELNILEYLEDQEAQNLDVRNQVYCWG